MESSVICPVCTLFLRPGMSLASHLELHSKEKLIEVMVKWNGKSETVVDDIPPLVPVTSKAPTQILPQPWIAGGPTPCMPSVPVFTPGTPVQIGQSLPAAVGQPLLTMPHQLSQTVAGSNASSQGNHSFFYQQIMSSSTPPAPTSYIHHNGVPIPIYDQPTFPQFVYQQQQMFMSSGPPPLVPIGGSDTITQKEEKPNSQNSLPQIIEIQDNQIVQDMVDQDMDTLKSTEEGSSDETGQENEATVDNIKSPSPVAIVDEVDKPYETITDAYFETEVQLERMKGDEKLDIEIGPEMVHLGGERTPEVEAYALDQEVNHNFDVGDVNLDLGQEFVESQSTEPSTTEEHDYSGDAFKSERPSILMSINDFENRDENISTDSVNMRSDENIPPRGELSGQESNASDVASWSRLQYQEGSSRMSTAMSTYDLLARESWEGSDVSETDEPPPYQSRSPTSIVAGDDDASTSRPRISYKCNSCDMSFPCPKERRVHQSETHGTSSNMSTPDSLVVCKADMKPIPNDPSSTAGLPIFGQTVNKLLIKSKSEEEVKTDSIESSFDHIFNNIINFNEDDTPAKKPAVAGVDLAVCDERFANTIICVICCSVVNDCTLKEHQMNIHGFSFETKYKCGVCLEEFTTEPPYTRHLSVHPLECQQCGKHFYRWNNLALHIKRHLGIKPHKCTMCAKSFLTRQKLVEHINTHTGEAPLKCTMCSETFKRYSNLIQHRNRRHLMVKKRLKDFICPTCGDLFHSKKKLAWHKETHENKPKACPYCNEKFVHTVSLTRHIRRAHNDRFVADAERANQNVECPICKGIYMRSSLDTHIKNHGRTKQYSCTLCSKDFSTKWNLKLHKWTHTGRAQKPFQCELCSSGFVRESDYTAHMNSHKSVRPFTCNYCGAQFIRKYNCQRHVKEHERVKTHSCNVCGKTFHRSYYLNDHMRVHNGARPFVCHICGKTSATKSNHNKHVRIHHAREPVTTEN